MARRAHGYTLALSEVGPARDPAFRAASAEVRAEVLRWVVGYGLKEKDRDLAAGLDAKGKELRPISRRTRDNRVSAMGPADPDAPPLTPAYAASRTRLLLEGAPTRDGRSVEFWWGYDAFTGGEWGVILDYHRQGLGKDHRIKRDVIGLSSEARGRVREQVMKRWEEWKRAGLRPGWQPLRAPVVHQPIRIPVTGNTRYSEYTFGVGTRGAPAPGIQSSGFRAFAPGSGPASIGGPPRDTGRVTFNRKSSVRELLEQAKSRRNRP